METARVRKAFKYPDDEDINVGESAAGLDEQGMIREKSSLLILRSTWLI